jgi:hypothetical protein
MKILLGRAGVTLLTFAVGLLAVGIWYGYRQRVALKLEPLSIVSTDFDVPPPTPDPPSEAAEVFTLPALPEATKAGAARFDFETQVGVAEFASEGLICLTIPNAGLLAGSKVLLAEPDTNVVRRTVVQKKLAQSCSQNPDTQSSASFYSLELMDSKNAPPGYGKLSPPLVALVGVADVDRLKDGSRAKIDLDRDGRREYFRDCTSEEGVHLTIWSGKPLKGKRLWHWYYYLGYGVVPDCTDKECVEEQE